MKNLNKAASYYILKSRDTRFNFLVLIVLFALFSFALFKGALGDKSDVEVILILYIVILGTTILMANSMIVDLTVKDKLKGRIELFLGSGIKLEELVQAYSFQMLRISSLVPFLIFMVFYYFIDFSYSFVLVVLMYLTTVVLAYTEIYFLNVYSFTAKNNKLFKNTIFFGSFLLMYLSGMFSEEIIEFFNDMKLDLLYVILALNVIVSGSLFVFARQKLKTLTNEKIVQGKGEWA